MADLSNTEGGSGAINVSKFMNICENLCSVLKLRFDDSKGVLPPFIQNFFYPSSMHMKQLLRQAADTVVKSEALKSMSTGNFRGNSCKFNEDRH